MTECKVEDCELAARCKGMCNKHYYRQFRQEGRVTNKRPYKGYPQVRVKHWVSAESVSRRTGLHRLVLARKIGAGSHPCNWCGKVVEWNSPEHEWQLVADHLDGNVKNNEPENLVPACHQCNAHRRLTEGS